MTSFFLIQGFGFYWSLGVLNLSPHHRSYANVIRSGHKLSQNRSYQINSRLLHEERKSSKMPDLQNYYPLIIKHILAKCRKYRVQTTIPLNTSIYHPS